jgi:hypothetical protein
VWNEPAVDGSGRARGRDFLRELSPRERHATSDVDRLERRTILRRLSDEGRLGELPAALEAQAASAYWRHNSGR